MTAWLDIDFVLPVQKPEILHPMQTDPVIYFYKVYVKQKNPNGSWVGAVEFSNGSILLLGALTLDSHVELNGNKLEGHFERGVRGDWFLGYGDEIEVFKSYAKLLGQRFGEIQQKPAPSVWCSWYSFYGIQI